MDAARCVEQMLGAKAQRGLGVLDAEARCVVLARTNSDTQQIVYGSDTHGQIE